MIYFEIIWDYDEWCRQLPDAWLESIGCKRCGDAEKLFQRYPRIKELLEKYDGLAPLCKWSGVWWYVKYEPGENRVCIYPWPKRLFKTLVS